ncbi:trinucleotide repeat-containing gene 6B protein-like [Astyanax mexicanus]|uniref:Trinucleotide repeat-containing gene 6B protein-like n=1 Tax=Astyanax mexicanus TaxID=7994 RepID=A0A8T2M3C4_ASTMX|nr:trinucleotide repeat-containing gene 6B protein-like [Astyanax mexicanus]
MEDLRNTREEQSHQELSHEDAEQTIKELTSPPSAQSPNPVSCVSPRTASSPASAPCPAPGGTAASPAGGNNAKRTTVANGQPPSGASARFMPREVPPRFRNQQEPKVLLKRGQPLVGDISLPIHTGELSNANTVHCSDSDVDPASPLSSLSSATSTYANSTWGPVSGAPSPTQGMDKAVVVDGSDLKAWPSIAEGRRQQELSAQSSSASWGQESESGLSGAGGSFSPSMMWGPSSQADAADRSFSSEVLPPAGVEEKPRDSSSTPVDWLDCKDVTVAESKSAHTASHETALISDSVQQQMQSQDRVNRLEQEAGPKQTSVADVADAADCAGASQVPASNDLNPAASRTDGWGSRVDAGVKSEGTWGAGDSREMWGSGGGNVNDRGVSQGAWGEEAGGLTKKAATAWPAGGTSGNAKDSFAGSLQDSQMLATNIQTAMDNQKAGADDREGSECDSVGHGSGEDTGKLGTPKKAQATHTEVALQGMLTRNDLDPRVLCNTGWGQTQIKQGVAWDLEADSGSGWTEHAKLNANLNSANLPQKPQEGSQVRVARNQGWGDTGGGWGEPREEKWGGEKDGEWRSRPEQGTVSSGWGEATEDERGGRWAENKRDKGGWEQGGGGGSRSDWGKGDTEWGEERGVKRGSQDDGSWGSSEEERRRGWGGKDVDAGVGQHQGWGGTQIPNNQTALKGPNQQQQQQSQAQTAQSRGPQDPRTRPAGPQPQTQNQSSGWTSGPIPHAPTAVEPSGWEEPSPQSISRKLEIDDGTAAWGDPAHYDSKSVNMWEKSGPPQQRGQTTRPAATAPTSRDKNTAPAGWDRGGPPEPAADNGTTSWGKTFDAPSGWRDSEDSGKGGGWGGSHSNSAKSGSKSMQEGWGDEGSNSSRHSSWEEEDSGPGVWGGRGPQGGSSFTAGGWNQGQGGKRICGKGPPKGNGGDSWTSPMSRQFSNMGIADEEAGGASDRPRRGMNDFNGEMRKGGRGGMAFRSQSSKDMGPGETGPYYDKTGGHGVFGGGGGIPQLRGMQQPGVHPMNPSPGIRAQVPHQFLPPQVSGSMLKPMPPPSGGMFPPQLSPQHLAMLSGIPPQMQQFQLACQLLLQQQQQQQQQQQHFLSQRKFPPPLRQQHDPQQLARIMAILQQQRQQQGVGGAKLSPSHLAGVAPKQPDGPLLHPAMGGSLADLHPKSPNTFPGFGSGPELESVMGGPVGGLKDAGGSQSRFKWMMEAGHPLAPSPPDPMLHKNGLLPGPMKLRGDSPYSQYDLLGAETLGMTDSWHRTPGGKLGATPGTPAWPQEFQPGVPWKGVKSPDPDPDPDPYMTSSSMLASPALSDTDHQLLQDNTESNPSLNTLLPSPGAWPYSASENPLTAHNSAKFTDYKSSWPPEPIGHSKSWRTNRNSSHLPRPPPGLTNQKQPSSSPWSGTGPRMPRGWGPGGRSQDSPFGTETAWSGGSSAGSSWLLLSNLTPQIDGSTLRTICLQHGPLMTFHLGLTQGSALIRYCSPHEAAKAQTALHMCVLGNTTILAEFVSEEEVAHFFTHSQSSGGAGSPDRSSVSEPAGREGERERERSGGGGGMVDTGGGGGEAAAGWQGLDVSGGLTGGPAVEGPGLALFSQWSSSGAEGQGGGVWGGVTPGYHSTSLWGAPQMEDSPPGLLPGDLLGGGADTL